MYASLQRTKTIQNFNVWAYEDNGLVRGSGLFVSTSGVSSYHHFLLPKENSEYSFEAGDYSLQIFVETVDKKPIKLFEEQLTITKQQSICLEQGQALYYDWAPNTQNYFSHIDSNS
ncbi:MAG: hypothetical protein JO080_05560 [Mucilaginibacter sp.]|nr:hypothetical protein [Mucilaginibacter sp.]